MPHFSSFVVAVISASFGLSVQSNVWFRSWCCLWVDPPEFRLMLSCPDFGALLTQDIKSKSKLYYDRRSVGQSFLVSGTHLIFRPLWICWWRAPFLTRSRVCSLRFMLGVTSAAFLRSESHGTHEHILLSPFFRFLQPGGQTLSVSVPSTHFRLATNCFFPL
jgi:hypothetical protein